MRGSKRKTGSFEEIDLFAELEMNSRDDEAAQTSESPKILPVPENQENTPAVSKEPGLVKKHSMNPGFPKIIIRDRPRETPEREDDGPDLIDISRASAFLEVSDATVRNWVKLGRIVPAGQEGRRSLFRKKDILDLRDAIASDDADGSLKRRRNKTWASGSGTYCSYITKNRTNIAAVDKVTAMISACSSGLSPEKGRILLADAAVKMLHARGLFGCPDLVSWLERGLGEPLTPLIRDLLPDFGEVREFVRDCEALSGIARARDPITPRVMR